MNQLDLNGRNAVVTGGASGLGFAIAERLAASAAKVVIWDLNGEAAQAAGKRLGCLSMAADVSDLTSVTCAVQKSLGKELADTSVRVNCVTPAAVRTPLFAQMTQAHIDYMLSKIPLGRLGEPQEIAALVAWLASEECSFSTGAVFDLSGGRSTY